MQEFKLSDEFVERARSDFSGKGCADRYLWLSTALTFDALRYEDTNLAKIRCFARGSASPSSSSYLNCCDVLHLSLKQCRLVTSVIEECNEIHESAMLKSSGWYNNDRNYSKILGDVVRLKRDAMGKLKFWIENKDEWASDNTRRSILEVSRMS